MDSVEIPHGEVIVMNCRVIGVDAIANHEPVLIEACVDACSGLCVVVCIHLQTSFGSMYKCTLYKGLWTNNDICAHTN